MDYRAIETHYGPDIRGNDWLHEGGNVVACGGILQVGAPEDAVVSCQSYPFKSGVLGGDVALSATFQLEAFEEDSEFRAHFFRAGKTPEASGIRFVIHHGGIEIWLRDERVFQKEMMVDRFFRPHKLTVATLMDRFVVRLDGRALVDGRMAPPYTDNEGAFALSLHRADARLLAFAEEHIAAPERPPAWQRTKLLYEEKFGPKSFASRWVCNGEPPECRGDSFIFNFMSNAVLRRRFKGPLAVDFVATPMPAPRHLSYGVTDAIFLWMVDKEEGDLLDYLSDLPDAELSRLEPLSLYWVDFGGSNNVTTRMRKNPRRHLVRQFTDRARLLERDRSYAITMVANGDFVEFWVDGKPWIQAQDPYALKIGHIGFRAYMADLQISDLKIWRIK